MRNREGVMRLPPLRRCSPWLVLPALALTLPLAALSSPSTCPLANGATPPPEMRLQKSHICPKDAVILRCAQDLLRGPGCHRPTPISPGRVGGSPASRPHRRSFAALRMTAFLLQH